MILVKNYKNLLFLKRLSNVPRLKSRGFLQNDLGHSSPVLKDSGYSGRLNKILLRDQKGT